MPSCDDWPNDCSLLAARGKGPHATSETTPLDPAALIGQHSPLKNVLLFVTIHHISLLQTTFDTCKMQ